MPQKVPGFFFFTFSPRDHPLVTSDHVSIYWPVFALIARGLKCPFLGVVTEKILELLFDNLTRCVTFHYMKFSEALLKYKHDRIVRLYDAARIACQHAELFEAETLVFLALVTRLKELSGKPIVCGI